MAVCCFSEHVDNFLMWSHYANCYNGICIEYDLQEIDKTNTLSPVIYTEELIRARDFMTKEEFNNNISKGLFEAAIRAVISKHSQWSYENEWRIIKALDSNDANYIKMPVPKNIYIGFKVETRMMEKVIQIAKKLGVNGIFVTRISSNEYKLIYEQIK